MTRQELNAKAEANLKQLRQQYRSSYQHAALRQLVGAPAWESIDAVMRRQAMRMARLAA